MVRLMILGLLLGLLPPAGKARAETEMAIRLASPLPPTSTIGRNQLFFKQEVERHLKGLRLTIEEKHAFKDLLSALRNGDIEIASVPLSAFQSTIPATQVMYIPFLFGSHADVQAALDMGSPLRRKIDEAIAAAGFRVLWWQYYGGSLFVSAGAPIRSPDELRGKSVRTFSSPLMLEWLRAIGATPTAAGTDQIYDLLRSGRVEIAITGADAISAFKLWELRDQVTVQSAIYLHLVSVMTERTWSKLSQRQQLVFQSVAKIAEATIQDDQQKTDEAALNMAKQHGMSLHESSPEQRMAWKGSAVPVVWKFVSGSDPLSKELFSLAVNLQK